MPSINSVSNATVIKNPDLPLHDRASTVELTAVPYSGYAFVGWSDSATGTNNPITLTMNSNKLVTATFGTLTLVHNFPTFTSVNTGETMDKTLKPPYIKKVADRGNIAVWVVDGTYVRTHLDEEFTNYGHHLSFECIPANEFWLDREASEDEQKFFIDHLLVEHRLMAKGVPYDDALEAADRGEMLERKRAGDVRRLTTGGTLPDAKQVHVKLWKTLESGVFVWIVNGRLVRSVFDVDFTEGGHDHVYEFVPQNEVWIDDDLEEAERPYVLLHELHERNLMAKGSTYSKAHEDSSKLEYHCRHHPNELHAALAHEGWE